VTIVSPKHEPGDPGDAGWLDVIASAKDIIEWGLLLPFIVPHEASHVVMSRVFGLRVNGGGVMLGCAGILRGRRLPRIYGFFVQHEGTDAWKSVLISVAPVFWLLPYWALLEAELFWPALFCLLVAITVVSDVLSLIVWYLFDEERVRELAGGRDAKYVYLVGGPDQWQTELSRYE